MCPCHLAETSLDQPASGVAPEDHLRGAEALLRRRARRKLCAQARAELIGMEVEDGELPQVAGRQQTPVTSTACDR